MIPDRRARAIPHRSATACPRRAMPLAASSYGVDQRRRPRAARTVPWGGPGRAGTATPSALCPPARSGSPLGGGVAARLAILPVLARRPIGPTTTASRPSARPGSPSAGRRRPVRVPRGEMIVTPPRGRPPGAPDARHGERPGAPIRAVVGGHHDDAQGATTTHAPGIDGADAYRDPAVHPVGIQKLRAARYGRDRPGRRPVQSVAPRRSYRKPRGDRDALPAPVSSPALRHGDTGSAHRLARTGPDGGP